MKLFRWYNWQLWVAYVIAIVALTGLFVLAYGYSESQQRSLMKERVAQRANAIDHVLGEVTEQVREMQNFAQTYFLANAGKRGDSPLLLQLKEINIGKYFHSDSVRYPLTKEKLAAYSGKGPIRWGRNPDYFRELNMALYLSSFMENGARLIPGFDRVYYISKSEFAGTYPWVPSTSFKYKDAYYNYPFYTLATPEKNPKREQKWTEPYLDNHGRGLMITTLAPVYEGDIFRGSIAVDIRLDTLRKYVAGMQQATGKLYLVTNKNEVLAYAKTDTVPDSTVAALRHMLPERIRDKAQQLFTRDSYTMHGEDGYQYVYANLRNAPFKLLYLTSSRDELIANFSKTGLMLICGLVAITLIFLISNTTTKRSFIAPAEKLIRHIEIRSRHLPSDEDKNAPKGWQPFFTTINEAFDTNHRVMEQLVDQKEVLEKRLEHRQEEIEEAQAARAETERKLQHAQTQLLQQEKYASLATLVEGIALEIRNTQAASEDFEQAKNAFIPHLRSLIESQRAKLDPALLPELETTLAEFEKESANIACKLHGNKALLNKILEISGHQAPDPAPVELNSFIEENISLAQQALSTQYPEIPVHIERKFDEAAGAVPIRPQEMSRAIINIFRNAYMAAFDKKKNLPGSFTPEVLVETRRNNGHVEIHVRDNGVGIPKDIREKIFDPFFTTKNNGEAAGLGLSSSLEIVKNHRGDLVIDSQEGKFTEVVISLPVSNA